MNEDTAFEILLKVENLTDLKNLCNTNKLYFQVCKNNKNAILKRILEIKYGVNFIKSLNLSPSMLYNKYIEEEKIYSLTRTNLGMMGSAYELMCYSKNINELIDFTKTILNEFEYYTENKIGYKYYLIDTQTDDVYFIKELPSIFKKLLNNQIIKIKRVRDTLLNDIQTELRNKGILRSPKAFINMNSKTFWEYYTKYYYYINYGVDYESAKKDLKTEEAILFSKDKVVDLYNIFQIEVRRIQHLLINYPDLNPSENIFLTKEEIIKRAEDAFREWDL